MINTDCTNNNYVFFPSALTDFEEPAVVKQYAAGSLYNLLAKWDDINKSTQIGKSLMLPSWHVLDEFTKLLSHVYWLPTLSEMFGNKALEDTPMDEGISKFSSHLVFLFQTCVRMW